MENGITLKIFLRERLDPKFVCVCMKLPHFLTEKSRVVQLHVLYTKAALCFTTRDRILAHKVPTLLTVPLRPNKTPHGLIHAMNNTPGQPKNLHCVGRHGS